MATNGQITKIYELKTLGADGVLKDLQNIRKQFIDLAKAKGDLIAKKGSIEDPAQLREIEKGLAAVAAKEEEATLAIKKKAIELKAVSDLQDVAIQKEQQQGEAVNNSIGAYARLSAQYKAAKTELQDLAAEYGVNSAQALKAAESAALLKQRLQEINDVGKNAPRANAVGVIPTVDNSASFEEKQRTEEQEREIDRIREKLALKDQEREAERQAAAEANANAESRAVTETELERRVAEIKQKLLSLTEEELALQKELDTSLALQLEIEQGLTSNRKLQKDLSTTVSKQKGGLATDVQAEQLAALRLEETVLDKQLKEVNTTISNQTRLFNAEAGSLEGMQAELNLLQQKLKLLSETNVNGVIGTEAQAQIDALLPKVKELEERIGQFGRNVGNYANSLTPLFEKLTQEISKLKTEQQGLIDLQNRNPVGFQLSGGAEKLNQVTAAIQQLEQAQTIGFKTANSYAGQISNLKQVATQVGVALGTDSELFKGFTNEVKNGTTAVNATNKAVKEGVEGGNKFAGAFSKGYGFIRQLAAALPGLGISTIFLLGYEALQKLLSGFDLFKSKLDATKEAASILNDAIGGTEYKKAITEVQELTTNIGLAKSGFLDKAKVVEQYNDTIGKTTGRVNSLDEAEQALVRNGDAYVKMTLYKAAANLALDEAAKKAFEAEQIRQKKAQEFENVGDRSNLFNIRSKEESDQATKQIATNEENRKQALIKQSTDAQKTLEDIAKKFQTDAAKTAKDNRFDFFGEITKPKTDKKAENLAAKQAEADRKAALDILKRSLQEQIDVQKSFAEAEIPTVNLRLDARQKQAALEKILLDEETANELSKRGLTSKQVQDIEDKKAAALLAINTRLWQDLNAISRTGNNTFRQQAIDATNKILADQAKAVKDHADAVDKGSEDELVRFETSKNQKLKKLNDAFQKSGQADKVKYEKDKQDIEDDFQKKSLANQVAKFSELADTYKDDATLYAYYMGKKAEAEAKLSGVGIGGTTTGGKKKALTAQDALQNSARSAFGIKEGSDTDKLLGQTIASGFSLANDAMNSYFDAERTRIQQSLDYNLQRIDADKQLALSQAQTAAERDAIEKQFTAKEKAAKKEAGEQLKKSKKAEARIALATELANIAVQASAYPFPASLILGGVLAALAVGRYAINVAAINREQFAFGGMPEGGGVIGGRPHSQGGTPFVYKGRRYEAEAKELAIVRTKNAPANKVFTVTGTQSQLASAANVIGGGVNFKPGAKFKTFDYGGSLGESLKAPVFVPAQQTNLFNSNNEALVNEMRQMRGDMVSLATEQSQRIDRLQVVQDTNSVTKAQNKIVRQSSINTL